MPRVTVAALLFIANGFNHAASSSPELDIHLDSRDRVPRGLPCAACYSSIVAFEADIVVLAREVPDVRLVAEVKRNIGDLNSVEAQLRQYMLARKCSLGLLVTPERARIYRDTYADFTEGSVKLVGEFSTAELLDLAQVPSDERGLQEAVRDWLDRMAASWPSALPRTDAARAPVVQYLVPEVADGRVTSGSLG